MIDGVVPESQNSAVPFLQSASKVVIVMVTTGAKQGPEPEEIVANLAWHDVEAEVKRLDRVARRCFWRRVARFL